ncbi:hypothetical protein D3C85_1808990 [compost metagenome]
MHNAGAKQRLNDGAQSAFVIFVVVGAGVAPAFPLALLVGDAAELRDKDRLSGIREALYRQHAFGRLGRYCFLR